MQKLSLRSGLAALLLAALPNPSHAYDRSVRFNLPLTTPFNDLILAKAGARYLYPQQTCLDEGNNHLFIIMATRGKKENPDRSQWAAVYDWGDGKFLTMFQVGTGLGETCVVSTERGSALLWVKSRGDNLLAFDVTNLPPPMSAPNWIKKSKAPVYYQAAMRNGRWLAELKSDARSAIANLSPNFETSTSFTLRDPSQEQPNKPKRQAFAIADYGIVGSYGSNYIPGRDLGKTAYGIKVFARDGALMVDKVVNPIQVIDELKSQGVTASRLENEGVLVTRSNEVYTLAITEGANTLKAQTGGMVILQESRPFQ